MIVSSVPEQHVPKLELEVECSPRRDRLDTSHSDLYPLPGEVLVVFLLLSTLTVKRMISSSQSRWPSLESSSSFRRWRSVGLNHEVPVERQARSSIRTAIINLKFSGRAAAAILFVGLVLMGTRIWAAVPLREELRRVPSKFRFWQKQFAWAFRYPGPDGKFGKTDIKQINDANGNPFGIDEKDHPAGKDDIVNAALKVPVGKHILLTMRSRDVIHNFFVRELHGRSRTLCRAWRFPFHFQADKIGTCLKSPARSCAAWSHSQMRTTMEVMTEEAFPRSGRLTSSPRNDQGGLLSSSRRHPKTYVFRSNSCSSSCAHGLYP